MKPSYSFIGLIDVCSNIRSGKAKFAHRMGAKCIYEAIYDIVDVLDHFDVCAAESGGSSLDNT